MYIPVHNPTVTYKVETLGVAALIARPAAASTDPAIVTARHPKRLTSTEAMGPTPRVTPLRMEGMRETVPRPSSKASISSTTKMPKVYVIPSAEKWTYFSVSSRSSYLKFIKRNKRCTISTSSIKIMKIILETMTYLMSLMSIFMSLAMCLEIHELSKTVARLPRAT